MHKGNRAVDFKLCSVDCILCDVAFIIRGKHKRPEDILAPLHLLIAIGANYFFDIVLIIIGFYCVCVFSLVACFLKAFCILIEFLAKEADRVAVVKLLLQQIYLIFGSAYLNCIFPVFDEEYYRHRQQEQCEYTESNGKGGADSLGLGLHCTPVRFQIAFKSILRLF